MKSKQVIFLLALQLGIFSTVYGARAEVPVVDLGQSSQEISTSPNRGLEIDQGEATSEKASFDHQNESLEQRVLRLEKQIANMAEMNYASKLEKMQLEVQQLHGQLEVQNHDLSQLKEQLRNFYQDLDQRMSGQKVDENKLNEKKQLSAENEIKSAADESASAEDNNKKELRSYEAAFNLLNKKEYEKAINGFQAYLKEYPASTHTVNAHYWLGEIYYLKNKPENASKEFQAIINNFPDNPKVADALLKVALIAMDAGNYTKAKQNLIKVQKQFPSSTAAKIAALRLKEIKQKK